MQYIKIDREKLKSGICFFKHCKFLANFHDNIEMLYMIKGTMKIQVNNDEICSLEEGDIIVFFPYELHKCLESSNDSEYCCISLNPKSVIRFDYSIYDVKPQNHVLKADNTSNRTADIYSLIIKTYDDKDRYTCTALTTALFFNVINNIKLVSRFNSDGLISERIILMCVENYSDCNFSLNSLSKIVGLSTRTLSRFFKECLEMSFPKFITQLRLNKAIEGILNGKSITEVSSESGFGSLRTFNRNFFNTYNCSPTEYINMAENVR